MRPANASAHGRGPNGLPGRHDRRTASSSAAVSGRFTHRSQFAGRSTDQSHNAGASRFTAAS